MVNEKRLIDANAADNAIAAAADKYDGYDSCQNKIIQGLLEAQDVVAAAPTVDAVEVVHGRWRKQRNETKCSVCHFIYYSNHDYFNYCPNCGAKMDGGRSERE